MRLNGGRVKETHGIICWTHAQALIERSGRVGTKLQLLEGCNAREALSLVKDEHLIKDCCLRFLLRANLMICLRDGAL